MLNLDFSVTAGFALTWLAQTTCAAVIVWCLCRVLRHPRIKVWLWSIFIAGTIASWAYGSWAAGSHTIFSTPATLSAPASSTSPLSPTPITSVHPAQMQPSVSHSTLSFNLKHNQRLEVLTRWGWRSYLLMVFLLVTSWLVQAYRLGGLLRDSSAPSAELEADFSRLCHEFRLRSCRLRTVATLHSPATAYWWRPVVFIPAGLIPQVPREQLVDMMRHELTHVRHRDYLWERVASLACRLVFFHPAVWIAFRDLRRQRELACDLEAAGRTFEDRLRYADALLGFARWKRNKNLPMAALEFAALSSPLSARVHSLLRPPQSRRRQAIYAVCASSSALALLLAVVPLLTIGFSWSVDKVAHTLPLVEKAITALNPVYEVHKTHRTPAVSIRPIEAPPEPPPLLPDTQQLASITNRLDVAVPAAPATQSRVSLSKLAKAQMDAPSYAATASLRNQRTDWNSFPGTQSRKETKSLGKLQKTAISAAAWSLTYLTHEAVENEGIVYGKH